MGERKQGNDGNWYEKTAEGWVAAESSPGRSAKEQLVRGAAGMAGSALDAGQYVGQGLYAGKQALARGLGFDAPAPQPIEGPSYRDRFIGATGIGAPDTFGGQVGEMVGGSLPMTLATAGMSPVGMGMSALKDNLIRDVAASTASVYAGKKGYGRTGQMVAGVLAAMTVPTKLPGFMTGGAAGQLDDGAQAMAGPAQAAEPATVPTKMLSDSEVMKIAKQYDVKPENIREVAKMVKDRVMIDPMTGKPKIDDLVSEIDDAMRIFPNPAKRPTTAQVVGKLGGANFAAIENEATLVDPILNSRAAGIRDAVATDLGEKWDDIVGGGSTQGAVEKFGGLNEQFKSFKAQAWDEVPFDELPTTPAGPLKSTLAKMKSGRVMAYRHVPSEVKDLIENLDDSVTARDLQDMRARLGEIIADADSPDLARQASRSLKSVIDSNLDNLPEEGSRAYRNAVSSTAKYYELFPNDSSVVKALQTTTDRARIANSILKAKKPMEEFEIASRIFGQTEGGAGDLKAVLMKTLVGENIGEVPMSTVRKSLSNEGVSNVYKSLLGPEDFSTFKDVLKGYQMGMSGTSGTAAQVTKTQSAMLVQRLSAAIASPIKTIKNVPNAVGQAIDSLNDQERKLLLNELIFDLDLTRKLARIPTNGAGEKEVTSWLANFSKAVSRSAVRTQAAAANGAAPTASRLPAAMRAAVAPMAVNQPLPDQGQGGVR